MGRALVRNPRVFLFDEPLSNLDAKLRVDMRTEIKRLHQKTGTTIVYVTHDQIEAMTLATKIAVLKDGEVQQVGTPAEIYNRPANLFVADFMGSPAMNLIRAKVANGGARKALALARRGCRADHAARSRTISPRRRRAPTRSSSASARRRSPTATAPTARRRPSRSLDCQVEVVEPAGSDTFVVTHLRGKEVIARMRADADVQAGPDACPFAFNLDKAVLFDPATGRRLGA